MIPNLLDRLLGRRNETAAAARELELPPDFGPSEATIIARVKPFTMTSPERLYALIQAVRHLEARSVPGAFVECGVWRGGSMMAAALALLERGAVARELHLFDTFLGMPEPTAEDVAHSGRPASRKFERKKLEDGGSDWCRASLDEVRANLASTGYPAERLHFVAGKVEETIPSRAPEKIALLRLDTDWYESTRHELVHLYPRLEHGGVLLIDDYGHWRGSRKATDEYLATQGDPLLLLRIDYTGRIAIKP